MLLDVTNEDDVINLVGTAYLSDLIREHEPFVPTDNLTRKIKDGSLEKDLKQLYSIEKINSFYEVGDVLTPNQLAMLFLQDMLNNPETCTYLNERTEQVLELMDFFGTTSRALELGFVAFVLDNYLNS